MSVPEIFLLFFFISGFFGFVVLEIIDQWKRTQAYAGMMEQLQESICSISNDFTFLVNEYAFSLEHNRTKCSHEPPKDGFLK